MNKFYFVQWDHQIRRVSLKAALISVKSKLLLACGTLLYWRIAFPHADTKMPQN